ncbi:MAG TPA: acyl-CoA dehydrogenase family protein [Nevskia sp.]|nr:acyl-CoA dehydrogenase family protein [Nevskia sp.]
MTELRQMLADSVTRLFRDAGGHRAPAAEFDTAHWRQVEELGLPLLLVPEAQGGVGGGWEEALAVLQPAGGHAVALPLAESMLAHRLLASAGLEPADGLAVAAPAEGTLQRSGDGLLFSGRLSGVPWGRDAASIVTSLDWDGRPQVLRLARGAATLRPGVNLAGEPRDELRFEACAAQVAPCDAPEARRLHDYGALLRLGQVIGALEGALNLSIDYARERKQFGRPIGQFQAVQQQLAQFGAEAAAVACATRSAFRAAASAAARKAPHEADAGFQIAAAKLRANMAIGLATATAHQVHAAIGFTREHSLRLFTQRLMSWRSEFGNDRYWSERLGAAVAARGARHFWSDLTARDDAAALDA